MSRTVHLPHRRAGRAAAGLKLVATAGHKYVRRSQLNCPAP